MSKLINISDELYRNLKAMKGEEKSFTILFTEILERNKIDKKGNSWIFMVRVK